MATEPIEIRKVLDDVTGSMYPALDQHWVEPVTFLSYDPPTDSADLSDLTDWLHLTDILYNDLECLLCRPCHAFWSQVLYDQSLSICMDSFLKLAPRELDTQHECKEVRDRLELLRNVYFRIFLRLMTCRESQSDFFTPEVYGELLYEKFLLDIPKLLDLCTLYRSSNEALLRKMVENIFKCQPKYDHDLKEAVSSLDELLQQCIETSISVSKSRRKFHTDDYVQQCLMSSDVCETLYSFIDIYPASSVAFSTPEFYRLLCSLYEDVLCLLVDQLHEVDLSDPDKKYVYRRLCLAQQRSMQIFRLILYHTTIGQLQTDLVSKSVSADSLVQQFCDVLTEHLGDTSFIAQYEEMYPIAEDISMISRLNLDVDDTRFAFIRDGMMSAREQVRAEENAADAASSPPVVGASNHAQQSGSLTAVETDPVISSQNQLHPVQAVKDVFPELGDGFVESCIKHYGKAEDVINALLEDNLPEHLSSLDRSAEVAVSKDSLLNQRRNVFDNDEFDIFHKKSIDTSRVHRGKRNNQLSAADESLKSKVKELAAAVDDMSLAEIGRPTAIPGLASASSGDLLSVYEYDDEYDDTYDSNEVGANDDDGPMELMGRKLVLPDALRGAGGEQSESQQEDGDQEEQAAGGSQGSDNREQSSGRYQQRGQQRPRQNYDVKGGPKGQGQSAEVIRNRQYKSQHKGRGANHNRKAGSKAKMSKGMF